MLPDPPLSPAVIPVILAGGAGVRLQPWSRATCPKPFLPLRGGSLLQQTLARVQTAATLIVCGRGCSALAQVQARAICPRYRLLLEPEGRNTAPAVAAATAYILHHYGRQAWMLVMPSDQTLSPESALMESVNHYVSKDSTGIVTFGIRPRHPSARFGYILTTSDGVMFHEKPDRRTAGTLIKAGACWNSGIWLARVTTVEEAYKLLAPEIWHTAEQAVIYAKHEDHQTILDPGYFNQMAPATVDHLIMEQYPHMVCQTLDLRWRDLGVWPSLLAHLCGF